MIVTGMKKMVEKMSHPRVFQNCTSIFMMIHDAVVSYKLQVLGYEMN